MADFAAACLDGGARVLQVRAKHASSRWLFDVVSQVIDRARSAAALVIVNDRADIARLTAAGGVHVGQEDLSPRLVRAVAGEGTLVGLSTHSVPQIDAARTEDVDYLAIGPVYPTSTKETGFDAIGVARVAEASRFTRTMGVPLVAIGGITLERAPEVIAAGAEAVAVISDLFVGGDPAARVKAFLARL